MAVGMATTTIATDRPLVTLINVFTVSSENAAATDLAAAEPVSRS